MPFRVRIRQEPPRWGSFFLYPAALALSLSVCAGLLALQGKPALEGIALLFTGAFGADYAVVDTLLKSVPLFLCSLGVAVAFRMQVWNIGAEGQYALGAVGGTFAVLSFPDLPGWLLLPLCMLFAMLAGGAFAALPAWLRTRMRVNEIISTLMLNYIGILFLDLLVYGPWKDPSSFGFPMTVEFPEAALIPRLPGSRLHLGLLICAAAATLVSLGLRSTVVGYEIRASGSNPRAARYARIPYAGLVLLVMGVCGALAGLAGFIEASASAGRLQPTVMAGYGYTAIVVAWLARLNPVSIAVASILLAGLRVGVENLQLELQIPAAFGQIVEGLILLSVIAGQFFTRYRVERTGKAAIAKASESRND